MIASRGIITMFLVDVAAAMLLLLLARPLGVVAVPAAAVTGSRRGCTASCGNVSIPYPFGVEPGCYLDGFNLTCNQSYHPPKLFLGDGTVQVLEISIPNSTLRIRSSMIDFPSDADGANRTWSAGGLGHAASYSLLGWKNNLLVVGCNVQVLLLREDDTLASSCAPFCPSDYTLDPSTDTGPGYCSGIGCCQAAILEGRPSYKLQLHRLIGDSSEDMSTSVFLADSAYILNLTNNPLNSQLTVPTVLHWSINGSICHSNGSSPSCRSNNSFCRNYATLDGHKSHKCWCPQGYEGNPYISNGCYDIDECSSPDIYPCYGYCENTEGGHNCECPPGFKGDASIQNGCKDIDECAHPQALLCYGICINMPGTFHCQCSDGTYGDPLIKGGCVIMKSSFAVSSIGLGLLVSGGSTLLLLALCAPFITRKIKIQRANKLKKRFFKQNHGLLLQHLISQKTDFGERMIIPLCDLEKATHNFDSTREAGGGGHGVVYKGILNLQVVAIKKSKIVVQREIDDFINEVAILSQINHRNVVKLIGCCLETEVPLLVYEFIANGTLDHHLHVEGPISLTWDDRIRIALEVARALSYLHAAASMPVYHRDIKSSNILLDDNLTAKVSDFGASRYIPIDQTGVTTAVQGTIGYLDPMYYYTGRLTDKSDVFSFGVLLVELLTRKKPFLYRSDDGVGLISHFISLLKEGNLIELIDPEVMGEGGEVQQVAALAASCTNLKGEDRPTMREVEMTLENLRAAMRYAPRDTTSRRCDGDCYMSPDRITTETSRQYTMEEEILLSARYPR